jgi:hypothetical protein
MKCIKCNFFKIGELIYIYHTYVSSRGEISITFNKISQKSIKILKYKSMVIAFEKWVKRDHAPKFSEAQMIMKPNGINCHNFSFKDENIYVNFDSEHSGEPLQVIITEGHCRCSSRKTLLSTKCYDRLIKISNNEIIDTAAI